MKQIAWHNCVGVGEFLKSSNQAVIRPIQYELKKKKKYPVHRVKNQNQFNDLINLNLI
jgi:hypothetical protein